MAEPRKTETVWYVLALYPIIQSGVKSKLCWCPQGQIQNRQIWRPLAEKTTRASYLFDSVELKPQTRWGFGVLGHCVQGDGARCERHRHIQQRIVRIVPAVRTERVGDGAEIRIGARRRNRRYGTEVGGRQRIVHR